MTKNFIGSGRLDAILEKLKALFCGTMAVWQRMERSNHLTESALKFSSILGADPSTVNTTLESLVWLSSLVDPSIKSLEASVWPHNVFRDKYAILTYVCEKHVRSWKEATDSRPAYASYTYAKYADSHYLQEDRSPLRDDDGLNQDPNPESKSRRLGRSLIETFFSGSGDIRPGMLSKISMAAFFENDARLSSTLASAGLKLAQAFSNRSCNGLKQILEYELDELLDLGLQEEELRWDRPVFDGDLFHLRHRLARAEFDLLEAGYDDGKGDVQEMYKRPLSLLELQDIIAEAVREPTGHQELGLCRLKYKSIINRAYQMLARIQVCILGSEKKAVESMRAAQMHFWTDTSYFRYLEDMVLVLGNVEQWECVVDLLRVVEAPFSSRRYGDKMHLVVQKAAKISRNVKYVRGLYKKAANAWDGRDEDIAEIKVRLALFEKNVSHNSNRRAKAILGEVIDSGHVTHYNVVVAAAGHLTDMYTDEYQSSTTLRQRQSCLDELLRLEAKLIKVLGVDFDRNLAPTTVPLIVMRETLGPAADFAKRLDDAFKTSLDAMEENFESNDLASLCTLGNID